MDPRMPRTIPRLLDHLCAHLVEPGLVQPTFLTDHPLVMSPLAREGEGGRAARFELFVAGAELCNAYEELNDPEEQRRRFRAQQTERLGGETDVQPDDFDEDYCRALELGLPPTGGWGMGVDRLVLLLCGASHMRDVISLGVAPELAPP